MSPTTKALSSFPVAETRAGVWRFAIYAATLAVSACNPKPVVQSLRTPVAGAQGPATVTAPQVKSVSLMDGRTTSQRVYYQTRNVFRATAEIDGGVMPEDLVVFNEASGKVVVSLNAEGNVASGAPTLKANTSNGYDMTLALNSPAASGRFNYGENSLKFLFELDQEQLQVGHLTFTLHDFDVFAPMPIHFVDSVQVKQGFQGWASPVINPVVANDGVLTAGFGNMINQ